MIILISVVIALFCGLYYFIKPKVATVDDDCPKKVQSFSPDKIPKRIDAIVIGSGMSSMSCAANLSNQGYRVVILEKSQTVGGCLHSYTYQKYEFDSGLHFIGNMFPGKKDFSFLQAVMDEKCDFTTMNNGGVTGNAYDSVFIEGKVYEIPGEVDKCKTALYNYFPEEKPAIDQYFDEIKKAKKQYNNLNILKMLPVWLASFLMKFFFTDLEDEMKKTVEEVILKITDNKALRKLMCRYYLIMGGCPAEISFAAYAMLADHYLKGSSYPTKGSSDILNKIIDFILNRNGVIFTKADVKEVIINNNNNKVEGVRIKYLDKMIEMKSNIVISTIGISNTYNLLENIPNVKESKDYKLSKSLSNSESSVTIELVLDGAPEDFGITSSNYWFFPNGTFHDNLEKFYNDSNIPIPVVYCTCLSAKSKYIHDKYPNKSLIQLITFGGNYEWFEKWRNERPMNRSEGYEEIKNKIANQMLDYFYKRFPNAKEKEVFHRSSSPLTNEYYINSPQGSCYGLKPTPEKYVNWKYFRIFTKYTGLYNSGQDVFSHGVLGAFWSGYFCAACIAPQLFINLVLLALKASRMK